MGKRLPMKLQLFAENGAGDGNGAGTNTQQGAGSTAGTNGQQGNTAATPQNGQSAPGVDYDKIQSMLDTATAKKENAVLKSYFQQQGLTEEEVSRAISDFKETKQKQSAQQASDSNELKQKVADAEKLAKTAQVELEATRIAMTLGVDAKTMPYLLKMADFDTAWEKDGKLSAENVKAALEKVLKDVPALKPDKAEQAGFQIGAGRNGGSREGAVQNSVPQKRWNRFNQ
nr:MAG TPA: Major head protein [Caudoviricetes sp.]